MKHIYPVFVQGRLMKMELLTALREYSHTALQLEYQAYSEGVIRGCCLTADEKFIRIGEGMIKCGDFIFLLTEPVEVPYQPSEAYVSLKFCVMHKEEQSDRIQFETAFVLEHVLERKENEIELCRFKLKEGARLRHEYKDFYDIQTEFDTINLADATWAGIGGSTLSKDVTDFWAREILKCRNAGWQEVQLAYACLQNDRAVPKEMLCHYVEMSEASHQKRGDAHSVSTGELFCDLEERLHAVRSGNRHTAREEVGIFRTIIMD